MSNTTAALNLVGNLHYMVENMKKEYGRSKEDLIALSAISEAIGQTYVRLDETFNPGSPVEGITVEPATIPMVKINLPHICFIHLALLKQASRQQQKEMHMGTKWLRPDSAITIVQHNSHTDTYIESPDGKVKIIHSSPTIK